MSTTVRHAKSSGFNVRQTLDVAGETGSAILITDSWRRRDLSVTVLPSAGTLKVQTSTSPHDQIIAGTALWTDWTPGAVAAQANAVIPGAITGLRCVANVSGLGVLEVAA